MALTVGIIGLPNVGKSSLFNALLKREQALVANYPFATIEPNIGVVSVPDERLDKLARWFNQENPPPTIPTAITFVDIAGLVKGASAGEGLGNQFLNHIKNASIILEVVRDFDDPEISREHSKDPSEDAETIETELRLKDLETLDKKISSVKKDPAKKNESSFLAALKEKISSGEDLKIPEKDSQNEKISELLRELSLLSLKPKIYAFNSDSSKLAQKDERPKTHRGRLVVYFSAISGEGLEKIIKAGYETLDLISFLTVGEKEARAWTIKRGTKAREAAGVIHSDFEKNFIRARIIDWKKLVAVKSLADAASRGLIRSEGKDYIMQDGDVVEFLVGK
ncbi:MAG: YchF family ATPase [Candidatus Niyogibacteria bacterium]|nr:MAG: YchF family ATPase [Candidatus Niyogibacteria bacterium]